MRQKETISTFLLKKNNCLPVSINLHLIPIKFWTLNIEGSYCSVAISTCQRLLGNCIATQSSMQLPAAALLTLFYTPHGSRVMHWKITLQSIILVKIQIVSYLHKFSPGSQTIQVNFKKLLLQTFNAISVFKKVNLHVWQTGHYLV
jgi:hypothetical protein